MSDEKKYYRTVIVLEVLSAESIQEMELLDIVNECNDGSFSGDTLTTDEHEVSEDQMATLLEMQRSSPDFLIENWAEKQELKLFEFAFESTGGRSIELAERIDDLRATVNGDNDAQPAPDNLNRSCPSCGGGHLEWSGYAWCCSREECGETYLHGEV
jgi:hypothetical protein